MRVAQWQDYEVIDAGSGEKLERWGDILLIRPDPQIIWKSERKDSRWNTAHARYHRSKTGGGHWEFLKPIPESWKISWRELTFCLKPMGFKHTGIFPEQAANWDFLMERVRAAQAELERPVRVLNLFGYTGAATLACLATGAQVTHVDASKGIVQWAKENAQASHLEDRPVRWLVDDCLKFVQREQRRGSTYDGIIMDPPSYGRGPGGEVWRLEEQLHGFLELCLPILSEQPQFVLLSSYATGLSPAVMGYLLELLLERRFGGSTGADELGLPVTDSGLILPCGGTAIWQSSC